MRYDMTYHMIYSTIYSTMYAITYYMIYEAVAYERQALARVRRFGQARSKVHIIIIIIITTYVYT